jgi:putative flippase GtrA
VKTAIPGLIRFGAVGGATFATNIGLTAFLHQKVGIAAEVAFALSLGTVVIISFLACRYVIFETGTERDPKRQALLFLLSTLAFRGAEYLAFLLLHTLLGVHYLAAVTGILITTFFAKFFYYRGAVFDSVSASIASAKVQRQE